MSTREAFLLGLADRMAGRPIIAHFECATVEDDAYMCGYDPHQELGLVLPEFRAVVEARTAAYIRECCPLGVPMTLPRNACEFPS